MKDNVYKVMGVPQEPQTAESLFLDAYALQLKHCEFCKHLTLQAKFITVPDEFARPIWTCLTCGRKWYYTTETVTREA